MGRRSEIEDRLIALLKAGLPRSSPVISNPTGLEDAEAIKRQLKKTLIIATYARGRGQGQVEYPFTQPQQLTWSLFCIAKSYRSSSARGDAALDLVDLVESIVNGQEIEGAVNRIRLEADRFVALNQTQFKGCVAYELLVSIETNFERTS